jgi:hypothetical protein
LVFSSEFRKMAHGPPVIRASGARCDIAPLAPPAGAGAVYSCKEATVQKATVLEHSPAASERAGRFRQLVLVRIACALRGATKTEVAADLAPLASQLPAAQWRAEVEREIGALTALDLVKSRAARLEASETGKALAARFLGTKGDFPRVWSELRDIRLIAVALGMQRDPPSRLKTLATLDGLCSAIVERAYGLKIKGVTTPVRVREALAATALKRAFGDHGAGRLAGKLGLSAKASRLLAAQLSREPRDFGTDTRLIAALAAEHVGFAAADLAGLRMAVLGKFFGAAPPKAAPPKRRPAKRALGKGVSARIEPALPPAPAEHKPAAPVAAEAPPNAGRPDLVGFASEVRRHAASHAQGWSGDRKAYISHVWRNIRDKRPDWGLSEIEFKCMLAEAHRTGQLALANADLKDKNNIKDVQESAVSFRNAVFHFIRVDA